MMKKQKNHTLKRIGEEKTFDYFNKEYLEEVLDEIVKDVKDDNDSLIIVDGAEGSGKSVLTACSCKYVDNTFKVDRIVFEAQDFLDGAENLKNERYKAIQYDEAVTGLFSTDFMKEEHKKLIKMLSMARKRNLIIFMCVPTITLLSKHLITHRASGIIHTYKIKGRYRGYAKYYSKAKAGELHDNLKKFGNRAYNWVTPDLHIRFNKPSVEHFKSFIDEKTYEANKDEAINKIIGSGTGNKWKDRLITLIKYAQTKGITQTEIAKELEMKRPFVSSLVRGVE